VFAQPFSIVVVVNTVFVCSAELWQNCCLRLRHLNFLTTVDSVLCVVSQKYNYIFALLNRQIRKKNFGD